MAIPISLYYQARTSAAAAAARLTDQDIKTGDSAGAHLASMASMTANQPEFQPGFEHVDTSVRGVVSLSGALDQINEPHHAVFFCKKVANMDKVDMDFLNQHSPLALVPKTKNPVPFLLIAGERDSLTESKMSKAMKAAFDKGMCGGAGGYEIH